MLRAYAAYDPEVNYCQGMNFLAALLLIWMPSEAEAFGGLVVLMQERGLRELYKTDMSALQVSCMASLLSSFKILKYHTSKRIIFRVLWLRESTRSY